ncbi:MAG TPA: hypothetical protein DEQ30_02965 [Porphyromonadaceae bacterium]|nr:hypothetical protein [Porphyromonadaceae bacterium]
MKTQVNGIEITPKMAEVLDRWYGNAISYDDTLPFGYVRELGEVQDLLCRMIYDVDDHPELKHAISIIINIKDDMRNLIPDKDFTKKQTES